MFGLSKSSKEQNETPIFFHEDYSEKDVSEALVGRKGKSLFALRDMDVPIPEFFVIAPSVYKKFLLHAFDNKLADLLENVKSPDSVELEKLILKSEFDADLYEELHRSYSRLSGFSDTWAGVRSSVVYPTREDVSFSGIFKTELNVKGFDHLLEAVKQVYLSVFKNRVIVYAKENSLDLGNLQMAVVVQRMIQPEVSGVAYTLDPVTDDNKRMSVEAVFGLGDVIAEGLITPDQYILNKKDLDVSEKHISPQEWMRIRKPGQSKPGTIEELQKIQISKAWSHQQKLEDQNVREVAKIALIIEEKARKPQSVEWVWESGNVWVLQSKSILSEADHKKALEIAKKSMEPSAMDNEESVFDIAIDIVKEEKLKDSSVKVGSLLREDSAEDLSDKAASKAAEQKKKEIEREVSTLSRLSNKFHKITAKSANKDLREREDLEKEQLQKLNDMGLLTDISRHRMEFLLTGIGASYGEVAGVIKVVSSTLPANLIITKETVLLIKTFTKELEQYILSAGGVLMDEGGLTSDISILCRERGIPAVVGTGLASALLKDGDIVKIDGNVGSVYRVSQPAEILHDTKVAEAVEQKESENASIKSAADRTREAAMRETAASTTGVTQVKSLLPTDEKIITATKVMIMPENTASVDRYNSVINLVDGVCFIDLDRLMLADKRHPLAYVEDKTFREYSKDFEKFLDMYADAVGGNEVIVSLGSAPLEQFRSLVKGSSMEEKELSGSLYGAQRYLQNKELLSRALSIVKKVRNIYKSRNISLAVHSPMNGEAMKEIKKEISAIGLKRTGTFNIYAVIDNPAEIILAEEILDAGIDGLIVNTPRLARLMQGLPMYGENMKYDIGVSSVQKIVESSVKQTRGKKSKVIVIVENNEVLIKRCIEWGAYGVAVSPDYFKQAKKFVSQEETRMVMGINVVSY